MGRPKLPDEEKARRATKRKAERKKLNAERPQISFRVSKATKKKADRAAAFHHNKNKYAQYETIFEDGLILQDLFDEIAVVLDLKDELAGEKSLIKKDDRTKAPSIEECRDYLDIAMRQSLTGSIKHMVRSLDGDKLAMLAEAHGVDLPDDYAEHQGELTRMDSVYYRNIAKSIYAKKHRGSALARRIAAAEKKRAENDE